MMPLAYSRQVGAERLIAAGRVVLAAFSLVAIWLDPSEPAKYAHASYALLSGYLGYALLLAAIVWTSPSPVARLAFATHAADLAIFTLFMYFYFTEGPTSPFLLYFLFSLLCGTLRWQWRGTLWTAVAALLVFTGLGVYAANVLRPPAFELHRFIMWSVYLAVMAGLLGYLAAHEARLRREISKLAAWPRPVPEEAESLVSEILAHAADILGVPRVLMAWAEPEEPWLHLAVWSGGELRWTREPPNACQPLVAEPLAEADFLCLEARAAAPTVICLSAAGLRRWQGAPLHPDLQARFAVDVVLSVSMREEGLEGRLFALDRLGLTLDDLIVAQIVGRHVAARLSRFYLVQRLQQAAASEERIRLARDLHDGLLQSLTGVALQLQSVRRMLEAEPRAARERLGEVQRLLAAEQADLRAFVRQLKPMPLGAAHAESSLAARLEELGERIARQWGLQVEVKTEQVGMPISDALAHDAYRIVQEALVNAARHAGASTVRVELERNGKQVRIIVEDNGHGFPFRGHYDLPALIATNQGPATLKERVGTLGGSLTIDSSESGAHLEIALPLSRSQA